MKKLNLFGIAALSLMAVSCSEDRYEEPAPMPAEGEEVKFGLELGAQTRTIYGPESEVNGATVQSIFWGNYKEGKTESIRVFCNESPSGRNVAQYTVNYEPNDNYATSLTRVSTTPVQWGAQENGYTFYAVYPADRAEEALNGTELTVQVSNGQTPVNYGTDGTTVDNSVVLNPTPTAQSSTPVTIYGNPDMSNALMYARTENVTKTNDPVALHFNVLTDVLEVTVNGPEQDNTLLNGSYTDHIEIRAVDVQSKGGNPLGGYFKVNLATGECSSPEYPVQSLHMNTALVQDGKVVYPKLYCRGANEYDKLKVRFFLWPGAKASDLRVVVDTNCGQFILENLSAGSELVAGKIHKLSLPHFKTPGRDFNLASWMSVLDDDVYISELSIPGAFHAANSDYQTQAEFNHMYEGGVRAYEVQARVNNGVATVSSGGGTRTLEDVLRTVGEKMAEHPTGFVYFLIGDPASNAEFPTAVVNAVEACKTYIYQNPVTENTTLGEVRGKIVLKINTNADNNNANEKGWSNSTWAEGRFPALFTRWSWSKVGSAQYSSMQWGAPIAPDATSTLKWYYNEQDIMNSDNSANTESGAVTLLEQAVQDVSRTSLNAYKNQGSAHNVFYLTTIGGCYTGSTPASLAAQMNPYMLTMLLNPDREASPTGIVLMNMCRGSVSDPSAYSSQELIKAIVYNNNNFIMKRKPAN